MLSFIQFSQTNLNLIIGIPGALLMMYINIKIYVHSFKMYRLYSIQSSVVSSEFSSKLRFHQINNNFVNRIALNVHFALQHLNHLIRTFSKDFHIRFQRENIVPSKLKQKTKQQMKNKKEDSTRNFKSPVGSDCR
uniref:Transmembrane protein n=1 Tax=Cacopsylla melanoneura TaxID=428564 RepID=A0A8D8XXY1_9HEMI